MMEMEDDKLKRFARKSKIEPEIDSKIMGYAFDTRQPTDVMWCSAGKILSTSGAPKARAITGSCLVIPARLMSSINQYQMGV